MSLVNCNNTTKSDIHLRAAEKINATLLERDQKNERDNYKDREQEQHQRKSKGKRYRDMRRSRTIIQAEQLDILYGCYFKDPNPGKHEFEQISEWVHLPKKVVQIWFQNMRARERKVRSCPTESSILSHSSSRRPRTHLSCLQLSILQSCYETCAHPNAMECEAIGTELNLPLKVVQIWFQNTRAKEKRWRLQESRSSQSESFRCFFYLNSKQPSCVLH
uniref:Homeobox domain-containing protein n=1 Tax=Mastacembelus armatus TaxID=205130 RepID=A0A7N8WZ14_9TELE